MPKQLWLELIEQENVEALWEGFPEKVRSEVTQQYARLMAQRLAARVQQAKGAKEVGDEPVRTADPTREHAIIVGSAVRTECAGKPEHLRVGGVVGTRAAVDGTDRETRAHVRVDVL